MIRVPPRLPRMPYFSSSRIRQFCPFSAYCTLCSDVSPAPIDSHTRCNRCIRSFEEHSRRRPFHWDRNRKSLLGLWNFQGLDPSSLLFLRVDYFGRKSCPAVWVVICLGGQGVGYWLLVTKRVAIFQISSAATRLASSFRLPGFTAAILVSPPHFHLRLNCLYFALFLPHFAPQSRRDLSRMNS